MKFKFRFLFVCGFVVIGLVANSCKKNKQDYIATLFTGGHWQLSSLIVTTFVGDTTKTTDTLYATCPLNQTFTFNTDNTCTYANFSCQDQTATGKWSLSADRLFLNSNIALKDSTGASIMPFSTAEIENLGQYSLVLMTGSLETYYTPNQKRTIARYGFVRVKTQ